MYQFLVVDGDIHLDTTFALMLEFPGLEVRTAHTGETALTMLEQDQFDLVIMEYWLPRLHGDDLAAIVKQQWPDLPIILATTNVEEIQKYVHPLAGVDCFLNKPFSMSQLREAILRALDYYTEVRRGVPRACGAHEAHLVATTLPQKPSRPGTRRDH